MKQAIIAPVYDLDLCDSLSHMYMVLAWLCQEDPKYKSHFLNIRKKHEDAYVILDNGMNEGKMCSDLDILTIANDIGANEIIAPDVYHDSEETIKRTKGFLDKYYDSHIKGKFNVMAVAQGTTRDEYLECYNAILDDERINTVGVGYRNLALPFGGDIKKVTDQEWKDLGIGEIEYLRENLESDTYFYTLSRLYFLNSVCDIKQNYKKNTEIHLLGLWNPFELSLHKRLFMSNLGIVRGCDSAAPCQAAQEGVIFDKTYGVVNKPKAILDFDKRLSSIERDNVEKNIKIMKEWLEDEK